MKHLLILFLSSAYTLCAQTPEYFGNNPSWYHHVSGGVPDIGNGVYEYRWLSYIEGDTIIDSKDYHILRRRGYDINYASNNMPSPANYYNQIAMFLRQEGRSIWYYNTNAQADQLLIDYNVSVGDTMQGLVYSTFQDYEKIVEEMDSILVNGVYRRRIKVNMNSSFYLGSVEGIADFTQYSVNNNNMIGASFFGPLQVMEIEYIPDLCYGQNNQQLWTTGSCQLSLDTPEIQSDVEITVVHIVEENALKIIDAPEVVQTRIYALSGALVLESSERQISLSSLESGIYVASTWSDNKEIRTLFVK